ncbi:hypothetical protein Bca4012_024454 [Brassica carinata]
MSYCYSSYGSSCTISFSNARKKGNHQSLAGVDVLVITVDPLKEPPLIIANTVVSFLAVDYPVDRVVCYVFNESTLLRSESYIV